MFQLLSKIPFNMLLFHVFTNIMYFLIVIHVFNGRLLFILDGVHSICLWFLVNLDALAFNFNWFSMVLISLNVFVIYIM